jgi:hypothetical protein
MDGWMDGWMNESLAEVLEWDESAVMKLFT